MIHASSSGAGTKLTLSTALSMENSDAGGRGRFNPGFGPSSDIRRSSRYRVQVRTGLHEMLQDSGARGTAIGARGWRARLASQRWHGR